MNRATLALLLAALAFSAGAAGIYRWVDKNGITHFSQDPPGDLPYQRVTPNAPAATDAPAVAALRKHEAAAASAESADEKTRQAGLKLKAETLERCAKARERIAFLDEHPAHRLYKPTADGSEARYTDEDYDAEVKKARDAEAQNCH